MRPETHWKWRSSWPALSTLACQLPRRARGGEPTAPLPSSAAAFLGTPRSTALLPLIRHASPVLRAQSDANDEIGQRSVVTRQPTTQVWRLSPWVRRCQVAASGAEIKRAGLWPTVHRPPGPLLTTTMKFLSFALVVVVALATCHSTSATVGPVEVSCQCRSVGGKVLTLVGVRLAQSVART